MTTCLAALFCRYAWGYLEWASLYYLVLEIECCHLSIPPYVLGACVYLIPAAISLYFLPYASAQVISQSPPPFHFSGSLHHLDTSAVFTRF